MSGASKSCWTNIFSEVELLRIISTLLLVCIQPGASAEVLAGDCTDLVQQNAAILETHPVDTVVLSFTLDPTGVDGLYMEPDGERDKGYLQLVQDPSDLSNWTIVLTNSADLNLMNPSPPPVPNTEEDLSCEYPESNLTAPTPKNGLEYTLYCNSSKYGILSTNVRVGIGNVNQYHPQFFCPPFHKSVNELTPISTTVYKMAGLAYDPDYAGEIHLYSLTGTADEHFEQSGRASGGFIRLAKPLDYDYGTRLYELNVTAVDRGEPKLSNWTSLFIEVTDGDDQNPVFDQEEYHISFEEEDDDIVGQEYPTTPPVYAYDLDMGINATVQYELIRGHIVQAVTYFELNETTGLLVPLQTLDREDIASFQLHIQAYQIDNPLKRTARSIVHVQVEDINDHAPQMLQERYEVTVPENFPDKMFVLQVEAFDMDEGNNSVFSFKIEDDENAFEVDPSTGIITVADYRKLDRERVGSLHFYVYAKETWTLEQWESNYSDVIVTLSDVNDNNPQFHVDAYSFSLDWPYNDTESLGWVYANDSDIGANGLVRYVSLQVSNCPPEWFRVDDVTGQLWALSVSANKETSCFLNVLVEDQAVEETQRRLGTTVVEVSVSPAPTTLQWLTTTVPGAVTSTAHDTSSKMSRSPGVGTGVGSVTVPKDDASVPDGDTMTPSTKGSQPHVSLGDEVSDPSGDATHPTNDASHPPGVSLPDNIVSDPASGVSHPGGDVSHPASDVSYPDNGVSHPDGGSSTTDWEVSRPNGGITPDGRPTPDATPDGNTPPPAVSQPDNGVTQPDNKVSHSDSDVSKPTSGVTQPAGDVSRPDSGASQPGGGVTQPGGDASQPDGDVSHPGGGATQPGGDPSQPGGGVSQPGDTVTQPTGDVGQSDGGVSQPGGGVTQPGGDVSQSGGDVSKPGGSVTQPGGDFSQSDAHVSDPGMTEPGSDSTQPSRDVSQPEADVTKPGGHGTQSSDGVSQTTNTVTNSDVSRPNNVSHSGQTVSEPGHVSQPGNITLPDDVTTSEHTRSSVTHSGTTLQTHFSSSRGSSVSRGDIDYTTAGSTKTTNCPPGGDTVSPNEYYVFLALMLLFLLLVIVLTVALLYTLRKLKKEREDSFSPPDIDDTGTYMAIEDATYNKTIFI